MRWIALILTVVGCGAKPAPQPSGLDTSQAGMISFLKSKGYEGWKADPTTHDGGNAHGRVRVFFNDIITESLQSKRASHPVGSALVKELYTDDGTVITAHAMNVKVKAGDGAESWVFFEAHVPDYENAHYGEAVPVCANCHKGGNNFVLSSLP